MGAIFFVLGHTLFNTLGNICFKFSANSVETVSFLKWQALGNFLAFVGVLSYSLSLKILPLHVAYPLVQGLSVLSVTIFGGWLVFREPIAPVQWLGILLIAGGISVINLPVKAERSSGERSSA